MKAEQKIERLEEKIAELEKALKAAQDTKITVIEIYDADDNEIKSDGCSIQRNRIDRIAHNEKPGGDDDRYFIMLPFRVPKRHWTENWRRKKEEYSRRTK